MPCVACNQSIKFKDLLETAKDVSADVMATGHYVSSRPGPGAGALPAPPTRSAIRAIFCSATRQQLEFLRFPLGDLHKHETRRLAAELGLGIAEKPDSQDICFVPSGRYTRIVEKLIQAPPSRATSSISTAAFSDAIPASSTIRSASGGASALRQGSRFMWSGLSPSGAP